MVDNSGQITHLLNETAKGSRDAESALLELIYSELHGMAALNKLAEWDPRQVRIVQQKELSNAV